MSTFNRGKPFHGSEKVQEGRLTGATDTDYFYFFCPSCPSRQVLRILDYTVMSEGPWKYSGEVRPEAERGFTLAFQLYCDNCGFRDFVRISNEGLQGGSLRDNPVQA